LSRRLALEQLKAEREDTQRQQENKMRAIEVEALTKWDKDHQEQINKDKQPEVATKPPATRGGQATNRGVSTTAQRKRNN
jgi:hypothetical protein